MTQPATEYKHAEAFCLMTYRADDDLTVEEMVWNSRDGVTPFVISLRNGMTARHVNWHSEQPQPGFVPLTGMRVFVDLTDERAQELAAKQAALHWHEHGPVGAFARERYATQDELQSVLEIGLREEVGRGAPDLLEVTEEVAAAHGWLQAGPDEEAAALQVATQALLMLPRDYRRDPYGYELSQDKLRDLAAFILEDLAQNSGQPISTTVENFLLAMVTNELPAVGHGYDALAQDEHVQTLVQAVLTSRITTKEKA